MSVVIDGTNGITAPGTETFGDGTALGGATNPIVSMAKGAAGYVQSYIINNTNGGSSSADIVAYPSNGSDSHGWVDMGITSLSYNDSTYTITGPNESYLFSSAPSGSSTTGNLVIATDNTGTANDIQFYTGGFTQAKSAAKMVIQNSTGNVGIGTTTPTNKLDVAGGDISVGAGNAFDCNIYYNGGWKFIANGYGGFIKAADAGGNITFNNTSSSNSSGAGASATVVERARIDSSGNLLVGTTNTDPAGNNVTGIAIKPGSNTSIQNGASTALVLGASANTTYLQTFRNAGSLAGYISVTGTVTTYNSISDYRLKENAQPMTGALSVVQELKPCTYTWKSDGSEGKGFIAHELQSVIPEAVQGQKDNVDEEGNPLYQGIDTSMIVPYLVSAIQEQQALISSQAAVITDMAAKLKAAGVAGF
jgi:hypothetical protein